MRYTTAAFLALALLWGCGGGGGTALAPNVPNATPTPPVLGAVDPSKNPASVTLYAFAGNKKNDGAEPKGTLTLVDVNGGALLFGRTAIGGNDTNCGTIFSIAPDGSRYSLLYSFSGADGCSPRHDAMTFDTATRQLYSTTQGYNQQTGGSYGNQGQIFTFVPGMRIFYPIAAVHTFMGAPSDGGQQHSSFSIDPATGILYGQTAKGGAKDEGMLYAILPNGNGFIDLHDFDKPDGTEPHGRIVQAGNMLYGIARKDGDPHGFGTVFSFALTTPLGYGPVTVLHSFLGGHHDGALSDHGYLTPVTVGGTLLLYGMTQCGGDGPDSSGCPDSGEGSGIIFAIDPSAPPGSAAAFSVVHSFQGKGSGDGAEPYGSLMYDGTYLYGTTSAGGTHDFGTLFRITPQPFGQTQTPQIIYDFGKHSDDGEKPIDNVIEYNGSLYGMTVYGGKAETSEDDSSHTGHGTVFRVPIP